MLAVISGASKGIGKAIAMRFAKAGFHLAICARTEKDLEVVAKEIMDLYPQVGVYYKSVDIGNREQVEDFTRELQVQRGIPDVVINNAGIFLPGTIQSEENGLLEKMMATNVYGPYYLTKSLLPNMVQNKSGYIFNICSVASLQAYTASGAYTITKHALHGFSRTLREELKEHGIRVSSVFPGAVYTSSWEGSPFPPERMMPAEDIADTIFSCYELSDRTVVEDLVLRPILGDL